jgi:alkylhydroperoxidase family enzyme
LKASVLNGAARTDAALRQAVATGGEVPAELRALVDKIHHHAHRVTDEDLAALKGRYSDDQLFEIVVAAAMGAGEARLRAGLAAVEEA